MMKPQNVNRRDVLKAAGLTAAGLALSPLLARMSRAADATGPTKKILFFTKSAGFQHSVIAREPKDPEKLAYAEQILSDLGAKNGFEVTVSKDGSLFTPEYLAKFDALVFYTTGDLTKDSDKYTQKKGPDGKNVNDKLYSTEKGMGETGKAAFLDAIKNGKGFMALHCGSDTFHSHGKQAGELIRDVNDKGEDNFDPYIRMVGGEFVTHGAQQKSTLRLVDPKFPGAAGLKDANFTEEWYSLKNFAPDLHVILVQDTQGMEHPKYNRKPYPETWARMEGKGRVFFSSLGHREDVWKMPAFTDLLVGGLSWITGRVEAEVPPNIKEVCPEADPTIAVNDQPKKK